MTDKRRYKSPNTPKRERFTEDEATGNAAVDGYTTIRREPLDPPKWGGRERSGPAKGLDDEYGSLCWHD